MFSKRYAKLRPMNRKLRKSTDLVSPGNVPWAATLPILLGDLARYREMTAETSNYGKTKR